MSNIYGTKASPGGREAIKALKRWGHLPLKSIARYLVMHYGPLYNNDIEKARRTLRYYAGSDGATALAQVKRAGKLVKRGKVTVPQSRAIVRTPFRLKKGLWLELADLHIPFHDTRAVEAAVAFGQKHKVDGVFLNGDVADCQALSHWHSVDRRDFAKEVEQLLDILNWLRSEFPKQEIVWKPGNHEDRLDQYFRSFAPMLADLPTSDMETILGLEQMGINYLGRKQLVMAGCLPIIHGHEVRGGSTIVNPARWLFLKWNDNAACAHFHRSSQHDETRGGGELVTTWSFGCLCDLRPDYNPFSNRWTHGLALVNVEDRKMFEVNSRRILRNGKVV